MGFQGVYYNTIDAKGRASIPARFRELLNGDDALVVTQDRGAIVAYPVADWAQFLENFHTLPYDEFSEALYFATVTPATRCPFDKQGRIQIPQSLRENCQLDTDDKINTTGAELEITYSADGKTAIFVSTREGSIKSPGSPYNFDIWISKNVDGEWQTPIHLGPDVDPTVGPNINTSAWELEPSFSDDGNVIYLTRYEPGDLLSGDLYVVQKIDGVLANG